MLVARQSNYRRAWSEQSTAGALDEQAPLMQEIVEFSLQMPGNAFLFVVLCAIALHRTPSDRS